MRQTPLGRVHTAAVLDGQSLGEPGRSTVLTRGAQVTRWTLDTTEIELLSGDAEPALPEGYRPITASWIALWEVRTRREISGLQFVLGLAEVCPVPGGWDSGQGLAALTLESPDAVLTLGGSDMDGLALMAGLGAGVPRRWAADLELADAGQHPDVGVVRTGQAELTWRLPGLRAGEAMELAMSVAWGPRSDDEPGTWFAVQTTPDLIRSALLPAT